MRPAKLLFVDAVQLIIVSLIIGATLGLAYIELSDLRSLDALAQELVTIETPDQLTVGGDDIRGAEQRLTTIVVRASFVTLLGFILALLLRSLWKSYLWSQYRGKSWTIWFAFPMFVRSALVFGLACLCCVLVVYLFLPIALPIALLVLLLCCWVAEGYVSLLSMATNHELVRRIKKARPGIILLMLVGCILVLILDLLGVLFLLLLHGAFIFPLILSALVSHGIRHLFTGGGTRA